MGNPLPPALLFVGFFWYVFAAITTKIKEVAQWQNKNPHEPGVHAVFFGGDWDCKSEPKAAETSASVTVCVPFL